MNKDLSFLTDKQRTAYILRQKGKKYREVAADMNITEGTARQHYISAERRIREYERYNDAKNRNKIPLHLDITLGELKLIIIALNKLKFSTERSINHNIKSDWQGKLPYEYTILEDLLKQLQTTCTKAQDKT